MAVSSALVLAQTMERLGWALNPGREDKRCRQVVEIAPGRRELAWTPGQLDQDRPALGSSSLAGRLVGTM